MHVLNLVNVEKPFIEYQLQALQEEGVDCTTLMVPGREGQGDTRSMMDYLRFWPRVYREIDDKYDLIHANYGLLGPMAVTQTDLPVVMTLWGTDLFGPYGWVSKAVAPYCDAVIVMSEGMAAGIDRDCDVIPHCVNFDRFQPKSQLEAQQEVGWDDDAYHVIFPYKADREEKNYTLANRVVETVDNILDKRVTLEVVWGVSHDTFPDYLNAADCLIMTSEYEGSPNVIKEALACNLPVVSTDVGDVSERLDGVSQSSICTSEAELVGELVSILRQGDRSNGRAAVENLSLEWMSQEILNVYERVLDTSTSEGGSSVGLMQG